MSNNANSRRKVEMPHSLRNKFVAALSMLLVSAIMLISSTYAWFTLSTAPEIKGITTQVGANGNLEMMLLNTTSYGSGAEDLGVSSNIGDSMTKQSVQKANETWGNLVDLSPASYGLDQMTLMPAQLNLLKGSETTISSTVLQAPSYGADGRVIAIDTPTYTATYEKNKPFTVDDTAAGVRAIGTSSDVSLRVSTYNTAKATANQYKSNALKGAEASFGNNAQAITNIVIKKAMSPDPYTKEDLDSLQAIITDLTAVNGAVLNSIKQTALAHALSAANNVILSDGKVSAIVNTLSSENWLADLANESGLAETEFAFLSDSITKYGELNNKLSAAQEKATALYNKIDNKDIDENNIEWADLSEVFDELVNSGAITVCGLDASAIKNDTGALLNAYLNDYDSKIVVDFNEDSGVYYDIAVLCGKFSAETKISLKDVEFNAIPGFNVESVDATINVNYEGTAVLTVAFDSIGGKYVGEEATDTAKTLDDVLAYMLDFGFRTNAAGSNLMLQTEKANRVYSSNDEDGGDMIEGLGSNLTFTSANPKSFTAEDVNNLMSAVRIAFVTPTGDDNGSYDILAYAKPDTKAAKNDATTATVTADIVLCDAKGDRIVQGTTTVTGEEGEDVEVDVYSSVITALQQNVAKKISVIVYLDGEQVDNTMVSNANKTVSGNLNLQFTSSANLVPMTNSSLKNDKLGDKYEEVPSLDADQRAALKEISPELLADIEAGKTTVYKEKNGTTTTLYYSVDGGRTIALLVLEKEDETPTVTNPDDNTDDNSEENDNP